MEKKLVATLKIHQTEFPALLDSFIPDLPSGNMLCPQMIASPYIFTTVQHV
jgi:hypothetical protein